MADGGIDILPSAVGFVFDNWTVLQLAIQHGFGGIDSCDKVKWFKDVIVQVLVDNDKLESEDLEDYISEVLYNEFHTIVEDGSLKKICKKLCQFQILWKGGNTESIRKEIQTTAPVKLTQQKKENQEQDNDEEMEGISSMSVDSPQAHGQCSCQASNMSCQNCNSVQEDLGNLSITTDSEDMSSSRTMSSNAEDEGWEVVRRSKKR